MIDQLEKKHIRKWNHHLKTSGSESLHLLLWTCGENEFYFHKTHAVDEFGELSCNCPTAELATFRTSETFPNLIELTKLSPKSRINAHWGTSPKRMSIFILYRKLGKPFGWISPRSAAGQQRHSTFAPWIPSKRGKYVQLFLAVTHIRAVWDTSDKPEMNQNWCLTLSRAG